MASEKLPLMSASIRDALRLQLLTGLRINEIAEASRSEIDFEIKLWTVPPHRTKSRREHVLPLSDLAATMLRRIFARADQVAERRALRHGTPFQAPLLLFPSRASINAGSRPAKKLKWSRRVDGALDPHAASRCIIRCRSAFREAGIKEPFNTHDLRRTVATQLGEMNVADEIIERILNHAPRTVAGKHYNHAKYQEPMRKALDAWGERLLRVVKEPLGPQLHCAENEVRG
jgi:integrase